MVLTSPSGPLTSVQTLEIGHGETFSDGDSTVRHEDLTTKVVLSLRKMWIFPFRNEDFTVKNDDFTKNNEDLTMEKGDLGMQNEDFTMKNEDLI